MISLLVAADTNNVIGNGNKLPWHLPDDLRYFKNKTWGLPILMGRKTFESIGKPLPGRLNIVITRNNNWNSTGVHTVHTLTAATDAAKQRDVKEIMVIGGAEIFREAFPMADRIYITRIDHAFEGDVYFPEIDPSTWQLVSEKESPADDKNPYAHRFQVWDRKV